MERIVTCIGANSKNIFHSYNKFFNFGKKTTNENLFTKAKDKDKT